MPTKPYLAIRRGLLILILSMPAAPLALQAQTRTPQMGYIFPAGAKQGTTIRATVGGQFLQRSGKVYVSGKGVRASVVTHTRPYGRINRQERYLLLTALWEAQNGYLKRSRHPISTINAFEKTLREENPWKALNREVDTDAYKLPEHPLLMQLEKADLRTIHHIQSYFFFPRRKLQENRQIAEHVVIELKIAPNAPRGTRELRLITAAGISNPLRFQVDSLPEKLETEPNDTHAPVPKQYPAEIAKKLTQNTYSLPLLMNGQIMPGDVDRIRFRAIKGQRIRARIQARSLVPYLADAVPGWFQCVIALHDEEGNELAYADDNTIDPDPILDVTLPADGTYILTVRDAIYRGRQDFVYRLSIASPKHPPLPAPPPPRDLYADPGTSLRPPREKEPNNDIRRAMLLRPPRVLHGSIAEPGDIDVFCIMGRKGESIVAETYARRLGSPLDSLLRLTDSDGTVLAWNDDTFTKEKHLHVDHVGLTTHHADAYLHTTFPNNGKFFIQVSDTQGHGSEQHHYRLRISQPQPDFALRVTPSAIAGGRSANIPITVHALRQDGFDAAIKLELVKPPQGAKLQHGVIPKGATSARLTLTLPSAVSKQPIPIQIRGSGRSGNDYIRREALPADNVMQAFLWRHLVPAEEHLLLTTKQWTPIPPLTRTERRPVKLTAAESQSVVLRAARPFKIQKGDRYTLKLDNPPPGVSIAPKSTRISGREMRFTLTYSTTDKTPTPLPPQNLIVQVLREYTPPERKDRPKPKRRQDPVGYLPAIPITG